MPCLTIRVQQQIGAMANFSAYSLYSIYTAVFVSILGKA